MYTQALSITVALMTLYIRKLTGLLFWKVHTSSCKIIVEVIMMPLPYQCIEPLPYQCIEPTGLHGLRIATLCYVHILMFLRQSSPYSVSESLVAIYLYEYVVCI